MPEFVAKMTPPGLEDFTKGYFEAAEWLLDEEVRTKAHRFSAEAIAEGAMECERFINKAGSVLTKAANLLPMKNLGHDFWLTRNYHSSGFWDRDELGDIGDQLTAIAHEFDELNTHLFQGEIVFDEF